MKNIYRAIENGVAVYLPQRNLTVLLTTIEGGIKINLKEGNFTEYLTGVETLYPMAVIFSKLTKIVREIGVHKCYSSKFNKSATFVLMDKYGKCHLDVEEAETIFNIQQEVTDEYYKDITAGKLSTGEIYLRTLDTMETLSKSGKYDIYRNPAQIEHLAKLKVDGIDILTFLDIRNEYLSNLSGLTYSLNGDYYVNGFLIQTTPDQYHVTRRQFDDYELKQFHKKGEMTHYPLYAFNL